MMDANGSNSRGRKGIDAGSEQLFLNDQILQFANLI
jgi:hypothetical protein